MRQNDDYLDADEERYNIGEMTEEEQLAASNSSCEKVQLQRRGRRRRRK